jgi:hypothetical protein
LWKKQRNRHYYCDNCIFYSEITDILAELKTDQFFAAFAELEPISQSQYTELKDAIHKIKTRLPGTIIFGGVQPEFLLKDKTDPDTRARFQRKTTVTMDLFPKQLLCFKRGFGL